MKEDGEGIESDVIANFYIGALDVSKALQEGIRYLDNLINVGSLKEYEIIEVIDIDCIIVNWNYTEPKTFEVNKETPLDDIMRFTCSCKKEVVVAEGWNTIKCPHCKRLIHRNNIIGQDGKFIFVDL